MYYEIEHVSIMVNWEVCHVEVERYCHMDDRTRCHNDCLDMVH